MSQKRKLQQEYFQTAQGQTQAKSAAERMRTLGGQAPDLQKGADLSDYMSQYTAGVTDPR